MSQRRLTMKLALVCSKVHMRRTAEAVLNSVQDQTPGKPEGGGVGHGKTSCHLQRSSRGRDMSTRAETLGTITSIGAQPQGLVEAPGRCARVRSR